jgi:hypothetical protein
MKRFLKDNALSLVLLGLFLLFWMGQALAGWSHHNQEQQEHQQATIALSGYLRSGDFWEATFENWESEFLQMAAFLLLSALLVQRGSAESRKPDDEEGAKQEAQKEKRKLRRPPANAPGPVHRGGLALKLYSHSLTLVLGGLFVMSFALHAVTGLDKFNDEAREHASPTVSLFGYLSSSTFWFESFQNWQSEFLSVAAIVVLSIFLRQKDSPESKPVHAAHAQTGT